MSTNRKRKLRKGKTVPEKPSREYLEDLAMRFLLDGEILSVEELQIAKEHGLYYDESKVNFGN